MAEKTLKINGRMLNLPRIILIVRHSRETVGKKGSDIEKRSLSGRLLVCRTTRVHFFFFFFIEIYLTFAKMRRLAECKARDGVYNP